MHVISPLLLNDNNEAVPTEIRRGSKPRNLRVIEELHYHSINDSNYISEKSATALIEEGLLDEQTVEKTLKLKSPFKKTDFYKHGIIYINERVEEQE